MHLHIWGCLEKKLGKGIGSISSLRWKLLWSWIVEDKERRCGTV